MRSSYLSRILPLCLLLILALSCTGVYATWRYATFFTDVDTPDMSLNTEEFSWKSEEILPDTPEDSQIGNNYMVLLEQVKNNVKAGLNGSKDVLFNETKENIVLHSNQNVQGGNLKHLFITSECRLLDFVVHYISDTELHLFLYENATLPNAAADKTVILVYRVVLKLEKGVWDDVGTVVGHSTVRRLSGISNLTIAPTEWLPGAPPTT